MGSAGGDTLADPPAGRAEEATGVTNGLIDAARSTPETPLAPGTRVDVRNRFVGAWSHGFEIAEQVRDGYRVRRMSDGSVLPDVFPDDDIRPERRKQGLWWY